MARRSADSHWKPPAARRPSAVSLLRARIGIFRRVSRLFFQRIAVAAFGRQSRDIQQHGQIVGLRFENLLEQGLGFSIACFRALAFCFLRQSVKRSQVFRVQIDGFFEMRGGFGQFAATAFDQSKQGFDLAVVGRERAGLLDFFISRVELLLPHGKQSQISPARGLAGRDFRGAGQFSFARTSSPVCNPARPT